MTDNLIHRLEAAEGPSRELDGEIALATGWQHKVVEHGKGISGEPLLRHIWTNSKGKEFWQETTVFNREDKYPEEIPAYTASLDAAVSLVPAGTDWRIQSHQGTKGQPVIGWALINGAASAGATPALALCIAALKAREAG